jgi:C4-dicarboxylate transporter DctQ subunit
MDPASRGILKAVDKAVFLVEEVFSGGGYICLGLIVVFIVGDIIGREFGHPITYSVELASYLQVIMMFLCAAYTLRLGQHIRAELFVRLLSQRYQWWFWFITESLALIIGIIITFSCWELAIASYRSGIISTSSLKMPLGIPQLILSVGMSLFTLETVACMIRGVVKYRNGEGVNWTGS